MKLLDRLAGKAGYIRKSKVNSRRYMAAQMGRLYADWIFGTTEDHNKDIQQDLETIRQRSIDLFDNNDWVKKFVKLCDKNIVGAEGLQLQAQAKDLDGSLDVLANQKIENAFWDWGRRKSYVSVSKMQTFLDIQHLAIKTVAREGEAIVRLVFGFDNPYKFALQLIPPASLPVSLNKELTDGHKIVMGIEYDEWGAPYRYYIKQRQGTKGTIVIDGNYYLVFPASEIVHLFIQEYVNQARGVPWLHTAMHRLKMLDGYEDAELVAARTAACQMGLIKTATGDEFVGDNVEESGNTIIEAEPGSFQELAAGQSLDMFKPEHPTTQFSTFVKMLMLAIASGGDVAYSSLTGDLSEVNYSSIRAGLLDERDAWKVLQSWFATHFADPIYEGWLKMALLTKQLELPAEKFNKFNDVYWQGRGWDWVDPLKDIDAIVTALKAGLTTWSKEAAKRGMDVEELFEEIRKDKTLAEKYGLVFDLNEKAPANPKNDDSESKKE